MANGLFSRFNTSVSPEEQAGAEQYIAESRLGELPALGETVGETAAFQPIAFGEGGTTIIDTSTPATQEDSMQAGFPIVPTIIGAGAAATPFTQLGFPGGAKPPAPTGQLGRFMGGMKTVAGTARTVPAVINLGRAAPTAAAIYGIEEAPKLFGSEKSTSQILTELAATTPEERAGAREYAALGADLPGLPIRDEALTTDTAPAVPMMGLETDPQGRMIPAGFKTRAEAYPEYERAAAEREERLRQRQATRERFPTGVPSGMISASGEVETSEGGMPDPSSLPSDIREIVATPRQMRTSDQRTRLSRFFGTTLGRQFGSESGIMESMMTPLEREVAEANLELDRERAADLAAGRKPSDVTYKTNPETGLIEQYVDGRLRNTFRPREEKNSEGETFSPTEEAGIKAVMDATGKSRDEVIAQLKEEGKL